MRILCLSAPLPGHLDWGGYLATAAALHHRGHEVLWASGEAVRARVAQMGVAFHALQETGWRWPPPPPLPPDPQADPQQVLQQRQVRALDQWLEVARVAQAVDEVDALVQEFQPDVILSEMFVAAAGFVAEQHAVPLVVMGWPAPAASHGTGADGMVAVARQRLDALLARTNLQGRNWTQVGPPALSSPHLHVTYWSPGWFAGMAVGAQTVHVGGRRPQGTPAAPEATLPAPDDAPWVLITLGTSFNADPNFFLAAAHATDQLGCLPLLAMGAPLDAEWITTMRLRLPQSAVLHPHLDFAATLPHVAAAIHHGGAGTTHALVVHGVPQIVVPHAADQMRQAQGVMRSGVGHFLPAKEVTIPRLVDVLAQTLPDRAVVRAQALALQAEFDALGGVPAAADHVEALLS